MIKVITPKANKNHACSKCGLFILKGETYVKVEDNDYKNGKFIAKKYHQKCYKKIMEKFKYITVGIFAALGLLCVTVLTWIML